MVTSQSTLSLSIVSPEKSVLEAEVGSVQIPGAEGMFGVLPRHAQLVSLTASGLLSAVAADGKIIEMLIHGGFAEISGDAVVILSRSAEKVSDVDVERAQQAAKRARERLSSKDSAIDVSRAGAALRRALLRERLGKRSS
ncbi:MAG: ATP synthase F1 subunit epsilon [Planctomycetes bacterium]|nr:ATP synthase F1 subunit epsilon [Planctomycetota bacterium]|tara:strand:+ start:42 stop:461 length:420 start_codon:yes stop_codon:yes gene_type:complete